MFWALLWLVSPTWETVEKLWKLLWFVFSCLLTLLIQAEKLITSKVQHSLMPELCAQPCSAYPRYTIYVFFFGCWQSERVCCCIKLSFFVLQRFAEVALQCPLHWTEIWLECLGPAQLVLFLNSFCSWMLFLNSHVYLWCCITCKRNFILLQNLHFVVIAIQ